MKAAFAVEEAAPVTPAVTAFAGQPGRCCWCVAFGEWALLSLFLTQQYVLSTCQMPGDVLGLGTQHRPDGCALCPHRVFT